MIAFHAKLTERIEPVEQKYDAQFRVVFDAIRQLMRPAGPAPESRLVLS
jgi:hypothetical protein